MLLSFFLSFFATAAGCHLGSANIVLDIKLYSLRDLKKEALIVQGQVGAKVINSATKKERLSIVGYMPWYQLKKAAYLHATCQPIHK
jgi:hypothetical protein